MIVTFAMTAPTTIQASLTVLNQSNGRVVVVR